ncbi:MAG: hypothetical protein ABFD07_00325 [Methanobacterium sp.]
MATESRIKKIREIIMAQNFNEGEITTDGCCPSVIKRLVTGYVICKEGEFVGSHPIFQHYSDESPEEYETSLKASTKILSVTPVPCLIFCVFGLMPAEGTTLEQLESGYFEFDGTNVFLGYEYDKRPHDSWQQVLKEKWVQRVLESEK